MANLDEYLENEVLTASPHRLHLMVVDGAIRFIKFGRTEMLAGNWEVMDQALNRARSLLTEMIGGINLETWPEMAEQTKELLTFIYRTLVLAELERNTQSLDDVIRLLQQYRETWVELGLKLQTMPAVSIPEPHTVSHTVSRSWMT